jgi:NADH-quinone oxidoreductase subunit G
MTATATKADLLLSAASFAEADGTVVNFEGRAQRYFQVYEPSYYKPEKVIRESWNWLHQVHAQQRGESIRWGLLDDATAECAAALPILSRIVDAAPNAAFRMGGMKISREPHRYSGRTAMRANLSVHEPRQPQDADTALAFSMEGHNGIQKGERPASLIPFAWSPGWNSPSAWNKFQDEVGGHIKGGDAGVRLIEPAANAPTVPAYANHVPAAFTATLGQWHLVRLPQTFGGEELSAMAKPIQERAEKPFVSMHPEDAKAAGFAHCAMVDVVLTGSTLRLPLKTSAQFARGAVGLPVLEGVPFVALGSKVTLAGVMTA